MSTISTRPLLALIIYLSVFIFRISITHSVFLSLFICLSESRSSLQCQFSLIVLFISIWLFFVWLSVFIFRLLCLLIPIHIFSLSPSIVYLALSIVCLFCFLALSRRCTSSLLQLPFTSASIFRPSICISILGDYVHSFLLYKYE